MMTHSAWSTVSTSAVRCRLTGSTPSWLTDGAGVSCTVQLSALIPSPVSWASVIFVAMAGAAAAGAPLPDQSMSAAAALACGMPGWPPVSSGFVELGGYTQAKTS